MKICSQRWSTYFRHPSTLTLTVPVTATTPVTEIVILTIIPALIVTPILFRVVDMMRGVSDVMLRIAFVQYGMTEDWHSDAYFYSMHPAGRREDSELTS